MGNGKSEINYLEKLLIAVTPPAFVNTLFNVHDIINEEKDQLRDFKNQGLLRKFEKSLEN